MSWITARRRRPIFGYAAVLLALVAVGSLYAAVTGMGSGSSASAGSGSSSSQVTEGKDLFAVSCASCHGEAAQGSKVAPSLIGAGAAAVDFQVGTGRMPLKETNAEAPRKPPIYNQKQIYAIAAFVASLGGGPSIPSSQQVSTAGASTGLGQSLFNANCAQCHNYAGAGGALTEGKYAPPLTQATSKQIYEAMLTGPEAMPVFNDNTLTPQNKRDIIAYVEQTRSEANPGGFSLGRVGPTTEGLVAWLGGIFALVLAALWITAKRREGRTGEEITDNR
ncbi:MAG TPA: c-type cytochrome [Streptosporangiaceae bacterium]|nr:c-type cytochrome [Streptosporangiaceae bacterium]